MTQNVADNALMLEVIVGADGLDPRQYDAVVTDTYVRANIELQVLRSVLLKKAFTPVVEV